VYITFVSVTIFIVIVPNVSDFNMQSNLACANARLKRKLMLKEKKMKCAEKSQSLLLDKDQQKKRNFTPLSDIKMMTFLIQEIPTNNDLAGYYKGQPAQGKTNPMNYIFFH